MKIEFLFVVGCLLLASCEYNYAHYEMDENSGTANFSSDVLPIFTAKCVSCHNGTTAKPNLSAATAYNALINGGYINIANPSSSELMQKINDNHPTATTLSSSQKTTIQQWIAEGALNN